MAECVSNTIREQSCRDGRAAAHLKLLSIVVILATSVVGISLPVLLARLFHGKPVYDKVTLLIKCFAAGVILSTSLVHVLPDAFDALANCQVASHHPWKDFPFSGFVVLIGALLALLVDVTATSHVHHNHNQYTPIKATEAPSVSSSCHSVGKKFGEPQFEASISVNEGGDEVAKLKQRLVSQVLEIGIVFHSVIIGVTMGMSQNKCTIRPLVAALSFHQIFEGMGLGGCIAQAGFNFGTTAYMCLVFSVTTPIGIVLGMVVFAVTGYDDSSRNALIVEGLLGSLSSGILIYMALVDLIAADFFRNSLMASNPRTKKASYISLLLGSISMSILALWA